MSELKRYTYVIRQTFELNIHIKAHSLDEAERIYQTSKQIQEEWMDNIVDDEQPEIVEVRYEGKEKDLPKHPWVKVYPRYDGPV